MIAARKAGWTKERIDAVMQEMRAGDYDHLLQTAMTHFEVSDEQTHQRRWLALPARADLVDGLRAS
jgi:hypothetical protein